MLLLSASSVLSATLFWPKTSAAQSEDRTNFSLDSELWNKLSLGQSHGFDRQSTVTEHFDFRSELKYEPEDDYKAVLGARVNAFSANGAAESFDADLELFNAYAELSGSAYSLKAGNQIVRWGKADEISPLDNINPEDFRDGFVRRRTDRKLPTPLLNLELFQETSKLQLLYQPVHVRSKIDLFNSNWAYFGSEAEPTAVNEDYSRSLGNGSYGTRLSGTIRDFDYGVSFLSAPSSLPSIGSLRPLPNMPAIDAPSLPELAEYARLTGQEIDLNYNRRQIVGFDFETVWEDFGLRGDVAYFSREDFYTSRLEAVSKPLLRYTLGADYSGTEGTYINLQFAQAIMTDWDEDILFTKRITNTFYTELSQEFYDHNLKGGIRGSYDINLRTYFYNPYLALNFWDQVAFEFGFDLPGGPQDTLIGTYRNNEQGYLILKGYF
ncbi:MAG: hypothetical protein GX589_08425 [Deltaproteobacteria bacterium]|nr:hypothetical protein [Deltaproteobacteria bacterium]